MAINRDTVGYGIALGVLAYGVFGLHDAAIKLLVADLSAWQVMFCRAVVVLTGCLCIGRGRLVARMLETPLRWVLAGRAVITLIAWIAYYTAARSMGLAQLITLYFAAPIAVTLMASRILGETVTPIRWAAVWIGFAGVMLAADPFGVRLSPAAALVLIAAALWGYATILMRQIARREPSLLQMAFNNATFLPISAAACAWTWETPDWDHVPLLLGVGALGGTAQFLVFEMARRTPASVMASVEYTGLVWAFLLGWAIWGDVPTPPVWAGAALIAASGGVLFWAERRGVAR